MKVEIHEEPIAHLAEHARVPSRLAVERVYDVAPQDAGLGGLALTERALDVPYVKDYDAPPCTPPGAWPELFDVSRWGLIAAHADERRIGGAVIAFDTPEIHMLEGRSDLALLFDIRVATEFRRAGIGTRLLAAVEDWGRARRCSVLKIETQSINVPACRFYARAGCVLGVVHRFAYPELPEEAMLLWYKHLEGA